MISPIEVEPNVFVPSSVVPFWDTLKSSKLPCIRIDAQVKSNLGITKSKFAGRPYIPTNYPYPLDDTGKPMMLLAQLNFKQIPHLSGYPTTGILQFFISSVDELYGVDFDNPTNQKRFKVIFHNTVDEQTADLNVPHWEWDHFSRDYYPPITTEHELTFQVDEEFVSICDVRFKQFFGKDFYDFWGEHNDDQLADSFYQVANPTGHKIAGYAYFTQEDPRQWHQQYQDYIVLLQIDSIGDHICWGDVGVANFFIRPDDLAALDFSKVLYTWDCT